VIAAGPRWLRSPAPPPEVVSALADDLDLPETLCSLLAVRGITDPENAKRHLRPLLAHLDDPARLPDASAAVDRLAHALDEGETILVHGDYDVDGVCATALYTRVLRRLGGRVVPFVPHRIRDGYDLGAAGLRRAREAGATLLVTADCGTVAHEAVAQARATGIDVVVTDHHTPGATLPSAVAVVNPARCEAADDDAPCGAGVAFKVASLLARRRGMDDESLAWYLDLVAVATVADLVPLRGENRVLARYGLRVLRRTLNPGLRALLDVTGLAGSNVDAGKVGFVLAPRINAAGRVGDADEALRLLLTDDAGEARALAASLDEHNHRRRDEDRRTLDEALALLREGYDSERDYGVVLASEGWHPGVIGIVASRIVERIHRPTVLVALDGEGGRGSARSIPGFDLYEAVRACAPHLERFGGHRQAAGMDLRRSELDGFRACFREVCARRLEGEELLRPAVRIDLELPIERADLDLCTLLRHLGPHGIGNRRPVFHTGAVTASGIRTVGKGHLKLTLRRGGHALEAIGFGLAGRLADSVREGQHVDAVYQLRPNEYRGRVSAQARLLDLRPSSDGGAAPPAVDADRRG